VAALARTPPHPDAPTQLWFRPEARQVWMALRADVPMLLRGHFAAGEAHVYDQTVAELNAYVRAPSAEFRHIKAICDLFADRFADAATALATDADDGGDILLNGALAGLVIACEGPVDEKLIVHLKSVAVSLFLREEYERGATFLRIARLDKVAAEYLLGYGQLELALRFIRALRGVEKTEMLRRLAIRLLQARRLVEALLTFVSCEEFQIVLHLMVELGMAVDAFFVKKYLRAEGRLKEANPDVAKQAPDMKSLDELVAKIDVEFVSWAEEIGVDSRDMKALLS
jgi:hypothetical protein